jgi:HD-like signal output (HDOD) protein
MSLPASAHLGTLLCDQWRLPANIGRACEFHTLADLSAADRDSSLQGLERVICLANLVALISTGDVNGQKKGQLQNAVRSALGCSEKEFITIMADISQLAVHVEKLLYDLRSVSRLGRT